MKDTNENKSTPENADAVSGYSPSTCSAGRKHFGRRLDFKDLVQLARDGKCVIGDYRFISTRMPAAFLISMQFKLVSDAIEHGIYEYIKKKDLPNAIDDPTPSDQKKG